MKRFFVMCLIISAGLIFSGKVMAQEDVSIPAPSMMAAEEVPEVSVRTGDAAKGEDKKRKSTKKKGYGGWGGPTPMVMMPNAGAFDKATDYLGIDSFPEAMFFIGGMGMGQLGEHFRIGGAGARGNMYTSGKMNGFHRNALIEVGYGGLVLYGLYPVNSKWDIFARALLGGGSFSIRIKGDDIAEEWEESEGFFVWHPAVGAAYHPIKWMSVELEAGYFGMILPDMHFEGVTVVDGGLAGGPTLQLNILFGATTK